MKLAIKLARKGLGKTSPNPMVGAIIVKNGKIIGAGYHKKAGLDHAEIEAIKNAKTDVKGAALYVNLEPCNHYGRTPPCADAIIKSGVKRVVAAMKDPNPLNNGKGLKKLRDAGVEVKTGVLEAEAGRLNEVFIKYITKKTPFVITKVAESLDGKIATKTGDSKWISGQESRRYVYELRSQVDAVMVGANTVIRDDPLLTSRALSREQRTENREQRKQPIKIIVDAKLKIPLTAKIFSKRSPAKVILATTRKAPKKKIAQFKKVGCEVLILKEKGGGVDLNHLLRELGKREITNVLVEGGGELIGSLVDKRLVDKFLFFICPKIIGGRNAVTSVEGEGAEKVAETTILKDISYKKFGKDLLIEGYINLTPIT